MGSFDAFVQRTFRPPGLVRRVLAALLVAGFTGQAVAEPTFEHVLTAVLFGVLVIPDLIAPARYRGWLADLERRRPILSNALGLLFCITALFVLLREFLDRTPSALIAVGLTLVGATAVFIGRRRPSRGA